VTPWGRDTRRSRALAALVAAASLLPGCGGGTVSVGVGMTAPAPWGAVSVSTSTAVPVGPQHTGQYAPMW
jgi:hypothetical protein